MHNGIRGVMQRWFESYLSNRKQYISIRNCNSSMSKITLGVPQGSMLGTVLFLLYIDDMYRSSNQMRFVHFAEDTTVFASDSDINNVIYDNLNQKNPIEIRILDSILTKVSTVKFLGVTLDENLTFNDYVKNVTT